MRYESISPRKSQLTHLHFALFIIIDHFLPKAISIKYILFPLCCSNRIKNANKIHFMPNKFFKSKNIPKQTKRLTKKHNNKQNVNTCIRKLDTNRDRKRINFSKGKMYRIILGPVYGNEKENLKILTNKEIYAIVKKTHHDKDNKVK
jgi:hypothetical protein